MISLGPSEFGAQLAGSPPGCRSNCLFVLANRSTIGRFCCRRRLSFLLGVFSFFLPPTEAGGVGAQRTYDTAVASLESQRDTGEITQSEFDKQSASAETALEESRGLAFVRAVSMFRDPDAAVFFIASLVIAMAMAVYFAFAALYLEQGAKVKPENIGPVMTLGQWVEIFFLFTLTLFIKAWGYNTVLIIGMIAWALRSPSLRHCRRSL